MSTTLAKQHARAAQNARTSEEKLDHLAKAIYELARTVSDIEDKTNKL